MPAEKVSPCFFCLEPAKVRCQECPWGEACSLGCLRWHRDPTGSCFPFRLERTADRGMAMVAARDIRPMEVILQEYPVAIGPYFQTRPLCLECFGLFGHHSPQYRCSKCHFPLCGPGCEVGRWHRVECRVFQDVGHKTQEEVSESEYASICTLRTLQLKGIQQAFTVIHYMQ